MVAAEAVLAAAVGVFGKAENDAGDQRDQLLQPLLAALQRLRAEHAGGDFLDRAFVTQRQTVAAANQDRAFANPDAPAALVADDFGFETAEAAFGFEQALEFGAPLRLLVPGWYGCTCIKWVDRITLVDDSEPATAQMMEFASRTHQDGVPALAAMYAAATIDHAAMPVRVEKWRVGSDTLYRVVGILWGGSRVTDALSIRFGDEPWAPVDICSPPTTNATWTLWSHAWKPETLGQFSIRMRVDDPSIVTKRLDADYYLRTVAIDEV